MKYFAIIFFACVVSGLAVKISDSYRAQLKIWKAACVEESRANLAIVEDWKRGQEVEGDSMIGCFAACIMRKAGFMNDDGTFNEAGFRAQVPADISNDRVEAILRKCRGFAGDNSCDIAGKMFRCYMLNRS